MGRALACQQAMRMWIMLLAAAQLNELLVRGTIILSPALGSCQV
jgi:hypothetical protein